MSVDYTGVQWNRQKRWYDGALAGVLLLGIGSFVAISLVVRPQITAETLIIRSTALSAFVLLHVILCIGPLARLDRRFLPLLFNRRHLGVTMFVLALTHASMSIFQFHVLGNVNPLVSVFTAYRVEYNPFLPQTGNIANFPFEPFGVAALSILFLMAATSHDFWLKNLGAGCWKTLHVLVLVAYGLLVIHVAYGVLQSETSPVYTVLLGVGVASVLGLHTAAAFRERRGDRAGPEAGAGGLVRACAVGELEEDRGKVVRVEGRRLALFLTGGRVYALTNVCRHQGGPLGEGRIVDGCVTCPWHGWQYRPSDGCSPPPFEEKVETYTVRVTEGAVWVDPRPHPPGTPQPGAAVAGEA